MSSGPYIIAKRTLHQPEGVLFAIMTGSLDIIQVITWLFAKEINNMTQNIDLLITLLIFFKFFR